MSSEAPKFNETAGTGPAPSLDEPSSDESTAVRVAPIKRIPFDIFQIIITMCQEEPSSTVQFTASHVCHLWREYVFAMPFLWNYLHINTRVPCWEMLETVLIRSGRAPLDIYIGPAPFVQSALPNLRKIMRMLIPQLGRWRTLHLNNAPFKVRRTLLDQIRSKPAPHLEAIKISQRPTDDLPPRTGLTNSSPIWRAQNVFVGCPNLKSVEWTSFTPNPDTLPSFKNLKNLILGKGTLDYMLLGPFTQLVHRILSDSPSLSTFKIYSPGDHDWMFTQPVRPQPLTLTHHSLQTLVIESPALRCRTAIIRTLVLPKLRTYLNAKSLDRVDISCCGIIAQENSLPELRGIALRGDVLVLPGLFVPDVQAYMPFLRSAIQNLAQLRVLVFSAVNFDNDRWLPDLGNCCPHLRWLRFIWCTGVTIASIRLLVETRIREDGVTPLEYIFIRPHPFASPECKPGEEDYAWFSERLKLGQIDDSWHYDTELETWHLGTTNR